MIEIREYIDDRGDIVSDELVDVAKEYEMLAKLNIVKEKDLAALKSELVGSGINEDIDEDSRFIRELSIASDTNTPALKSSTLEEELDKFEIFERDYIEQDAVPKSANDAKGDHIHSSTSATTNNRGKSSGWKAGFLMSSSEQKTQKKVSVRAKVEENKPISILHSSQVQEQGEILSNTNTKTAQEVTSEAVLVEKKVTKKAFSGSIVERF